MFDHFTMLSMKWLTSNGDRSQCTPSLTPLEISENRMVF